jgi:hypothetical protein
MRPENQDASQRQDGLVNMSMAFVANLQARSVATDLMTNRNPRPTGVVIA